MGAIKIRQLKYRQNYSFDSTSTAFFFLHDLSDMKSDRNSTLKKTEFFPSVFTLKAELLLKCCCFVHKTPCWELPLLAKKKVFQNDKKEALKMEKWF